jgi:hypothetical protein
MKNAVNRRTFTCGAAACVVAGTTRPAQAFFPLLYQGLSVLVTLWAGYKMVKEMFPSAFAAEQRDALETERNRVFAERKSRTESLYTFENPYRFQDVQPRNPGYECIDRDSPKFRFLFCCSRIDAIALPSGCIVALNEAVGNLRGRYGDEDVVAYTRPVRCENKPYPWRYYGNGRQGYETQMSYYAPAGIVTLQWIVAHRDRAESYARYVVRDLHSGRKLTSGATERYYHD